MTTLPPTSWSLPKRTAFRLVGCYLAIYALVFVIEFIPIIGILAKYVNLVWYAIIPGVGRHVLGIDYDIQTGPNGSGDTTFYYVQVFVIAVLAVLLTVILSLMDRRRPHYRLALAWLTVFIRYSLAFILIMYGSIKIIQLQFPFPSLYRLVQSFGDASPMGLAWTFMGYSPGYNLFAGLGEVVGGLLLFSRRTTTLGAIVALAVTSNIVMMNFSYDIPVKLFSSHLALMALFLLFTDVSRLVRFFLLNQPVSPRQYALQFSQRTHRILLGIKALLIGGTLFIYAQRALANRQEYGDLAPRPPLYGIYNVQTYVLNGDTVPPLTTDTARWKRLIVDYTRSARVYQMNDSSQYYTFEVDTTQQKIVMYRPNSSDRKLTLSYEQPVADQLRLRGTSGSDTLLVTMQQYDVNNFLLVRRGFHWINEYPFNR